MEILRTGLPELSKPKNSGSNRRKTSKFEIQNSKKKIRKFPRVFAVPQNVRVNPTRIFGTPLTRAGEIQFCSSTGTEKYSFAVLLGRRNFNKFI